jgi:hypothetical protein
MISDDQIANVQEILSKLYEKSIENGATTKIKSMFLGAHFCFADGNANRPDIATNATCAEALAWRYQYLKCKINDAEIPDFKVRKHTLAYLLKQYFLKQFNTLLLCIVL